MYKFWRGIQKTGARIRFSYPLVKFLSEALAVGAQLLVFVAYLLRPNNCG